VRQPFGLRAEAFVFFRGLYSHQIRSSGFVSERIADEQSLSPQTDVSDLRAPIELFQPDVLFRGARTRACLRSREAQSQRSDDR